MRCQKARNRPKVTELKVGSAPLCAPPYIPPVALLDLCLIAIHLTFNLQTLIEFQGLTKHSEDIEQIKVKSLPSENLQFGEKGHKCKKMTDNPNQCYIIPT